ncbi:MAG TPA: 5-formyltetrahydrofolate cyclo-ligase [Mobilitalea sp.]|nr:5-formyltetrahydrofolate cyclo-ligase [Mobilitalea sp.]
MTKTQIRYSQKELRSKLTIEEHNSLSKAIRERLFQTEAYRSSENLLIFVSFQSEVDTHELIRLSLRDGKKVYIPRVEAGGMEFYQIHDLEGLVPSNYGVLEPPSGVDDKFKFIHQKDLMQANQLEHNLQYRNLMILPGLAFDKNGNRIGYGAGYYDRYFAAHPDIPFYKTAIGFDFQIIDQIPAEDYDRKADIIITPTRIIPCKKIL